MNSPYINRCVFFALATLVLDGRRRVQKNLGSSAFEGLRHLDGNIGGRLDPGGSGGTWESRYCEDPWMDMDSGPSGQVILV